MNFSCFLFCRLMQLKLILRVAHEVNSSVNEVSNVEQLHSYYYSILQLNLKKLMIKRLFKYSYSCFS